MQALDSRCFIIAAMMASELLREKALTIAEILAQWYPDDVHTALTWQTPFELLIKTILSAQTTDVKVNEIAPSLFAAYPDAKALASANPEDVESLIRATGFFRNKARNIVECSRTLMERHGGEVPRTMEGLTALPGVGRKTANVVLTNCFGIPGVVVDTHVLRVTDRLGLASGDAEDVEAQLMELLPVDEWSPFSHRVTYLGRRICLARRPMCDQCRLIDLCPAARRT